MIDYDKISIWDGAPIENIVSPDEEPKRDPNNSYDAVNAQVRHTHRKYSQQTELYFDDPSMNHKSEAWQIIPDEHQVRTKNKDGTVQETNYNVVSPSDEGGPMQGEIRDWIEERIKWHTGSDNILHLRSWWSILNKNVAVPRHSHTYQTKKRTVSGIMWTKGDICPLYVQRPQDSEPDLINNVPGRCVIFSNNTNHWTEPYPHKTTRAGISFDYMIQDQNVCECDETQMCNRCMHLTKNLHKLGVKNIFSGGSTTVKYEMETEIVEGSGPGDTSHPITKLVKREFNAPLEKDGVYFRSPPKEYK
jgi:hypothetical protein